MEKHVLAFYSLIDARTEEAHRYILPTFGDAQRPQYPVDKQCTLESFAESINLLDDLPIVGKRYPWRDNVIELLIVEHIRPQ